MKKYVIQQLELIKTNLYEYIYIKNYAWRDIITIHQISDKQLYQSDLYKTLTSEYREVLKSNDYAARKRKVQELYGVDNISQLDSVKKLKQETTQLNYGVDNISQVQSIKDTKAQKSLIKYGVSCVLQSKEALEKARNLHTHEFYRIRTLKTKETCMKLYGVDHPNKRPVFKEIYEQSSLNIFGVKNIMYLPETLEKIKEINLNKYGVEYIMQSEEMRNKTIYNNLIKYGYQYTLQVPSIRDNIYKTNLELYGNKCSLHDIEIQNKIKQDCFNKHGVYNQSQKHYPEYIKRATYDDEYLLSLIENIQDFKDLINKHPDGYHIINNLLFRLGKSFKNPRTGIVISYGELEINRVLIDNDITFIEQYSFSDCRNVRPLRFDFAVFNEYGILKCLIEFDGIQHYEPIEFFGGEIYFNIQQENDKIKTKYCDDNNIKLIRIPYWEYVRINHIIKNI